MHTSAELRSEHFTITVAGEPAAFESLFPGFTEHDRLGIVVGRDWAGTGASTVVLAAVTAFYDRLRALGPEFIAYPDYFAFHLARPRGSLSMLDVFPEHKEPVVDPEPEQVLSAINDRGITRLLVEETHHAEPEPEPEPEREPNFEPYTRASAERRIVTALAYSSTGRLTGGDVVVAGSPKTESFVEAVLETATGDRERAAAERMRTARAALQRGGRPVESFHRITLERALRSLADTGEAAQVRGQANT
jgi:hypothetical protein